MHSGCDDFGTCDLFWQVATSQMDTFGAESLPNGRVKKLNEEEEENGWQRLDSKRVGT